MLRANGLGWVKRNILIDRKNRAKPKQAGKKERGLGEGIFARLLTAPKARLGWERFRLSALAEDQNRKIFFSLIGKNFRSARLKKCRENFSVLLAVRRAETRGGFAALRAALKISVRIFAEKNSDFVQSSEPNCMLKGSRLGALRLGGQICQYFPRHFGNYGNFPLPQNAVRRAKHEANESLQLIFFLALTGELQSDNFLPKSDIEK